MVIKMAGYTIARLKKGGKRFEILVDPDKALEYKLGRRKEFDGILMYDEIYSDAKKGIRVSRADLRALFGTDDLNKIAERILREGELLIKTEQRKKLIEEKKRQIINYISKYCVDARTNLPLPTTRIENVVKEAGVRIDPFKPPEEQVKDIISQLNKIIPIRQQITILNIKVPNIHVGKVYGYIRNMADILDEEWLHDGSLNITVSIPSGLKTEFIEKLGVMTGGAIFANIVEEKKV